MVMLVSLTMANEIKLSDEDKDIIENLEFYMMLEHLDEEGAYLDESDSKKEKPNSELDKGKGIS